MSTLLCRLVPPWAIKTEDGFSGSYFENKDQEEVALIIVELSQDIRAWGRTPIQSFLERLDEKNIDRSIGLRALDELRIKDILFREADALVITDIFIEKLRNFVIDGEITPHRIENLTHQVEHLNKLLSHPNPRSVAWFSDVRVTVFKMNEYLERYGNLD